MKNYEQQFYQAMLQLRAVGEVKRFLQDLCTPAELEAMMERWRVVEPLKQGVPYRKIHEQTGVSVTTIGRVARALTYGTGGYGLVFTRLKGGDKND